MTLSLAVDTDISVSCCAVRSESWRLPKKKKKEENTRHVQGIQIMYKAYKCNQSKRRKNLGGKILLRGKCFSWDASGKQEKTLLRLEKFPSFPGSHCLLLLPC